MRATGLPRSVGWDYGESRTRWPGRLEGGTVGQYALGQPVGAGRATTHVKDEANWAEWRLALLRFVHRLTGNAELAEDIAQEALMRYLQASDAVTHPRAWLFRVASNLVRDHGRRSATAKRPIPVDAETRLHPDEELERKEGIARVRGALDQLSERDRRVLLMREAGFKYAEIARAIEVRTETVPTIVMRALRRFRKAYGSEEAE